MLNAVRQYWLDSYGNIREKSANTLEMIHDAFQPLSYWSGYMQPPNWNGVAMDTHIYQMFSVAVCLVFGFSVVMLLMVFKSRIIK